MKKGSKFTWTIGDIFAVPLINNTSTIGQILGQSMLNTVRVALYDETIIEFNNIDNTTFCNEKNLISLIEITREQLDYGV
jgi:hypothetical protein